MVSTIIVTPTEIDVAIEDSSGELVTISYVVVLNTSTYCIELVSDTVLLKG
jgi:hypothetical protein